MRRLYAPLAVYATRAVSRVDVSPPPADFTARSPPLRHAARYAISDDAPQRERHDIVFARTRAVRARRGAFTRYIREDDIKSDMPRRLPLPDTPRDALMPARRALYIRRRAERALLRRFMRDAGCFVAFDAFSHTRCSMLQAHRHTAARARFALDITHGYGWICLLLWRVCAPRVTIASARRQAWR